jgi:multicomponent Na+:H+ antiporter subunit B
MTSLILRVATRVMLPLLLLFSVFLLLRGHNAPGGGFSGGLVASAAFVLYGFAFGVADLQRAFPADPRRLIAAGLLLALASGGLAAATGRPWMTALWTEFDVPAFGKTAVGTPLFFDAGVYLVVVGITLSIFLPLAEE